MGYEERYGHAPIFKARLHFGTVTAGEVGIIKKDIVYSGDVLNTTARIQAQCNLYGVDLLLSQDLIEMLGENEDFKVIPLGDLELRGKNQRVAISSLMRVSEMSPAA